MRYPVLFLVLASLLAVAVTSVCAQNPTMVEQQRDAEKERHFALFNELKRVPTVDSQRQAYQAAVDYLRRFEGDRDADARTVRTFVTEFERTNRQVEIFRSYQTKDYAKTFALGRAILEHDAENFFVLSLLTQAGIDNAQSGNTSFNDATLDFARKAIKLLEGGKVKNAEPFKTTGAAGGYLNAAVGGLLRDKSPAEAAQAFRKAVQTDSTYKTDPLIYHRLGAAILKGEFAQLSKEYIEKYGTKPPSAEQQAMVLRINGLASQALDAYARAAALSDPTYSDGKGSEPGNRTKLPPELRNRILEQLTALYKSLHNNSEDGLKELIATVLSKPLP